MAQEPTRGRLSRDRPELDVMGRVRTLNVWRQGDVRAPHKPLLVLLALGRLSRGEDRLVRFSDLEEKLSGLLRRYGPPRRQVNPAYPFWWLRTDGLWEVANADRLTRRRGSGDPTRTDLRAGGVGGFPPDVDAALRADRRLVRRAVSLILHAHFPDSLHGPLVEDVGIADLGVAAHLVPRDPEFRRAVIEAYGHRCAVCEFDVRIGDGVDLALEAAHLKWRQADGPDDVSNGLALCAVHHRALDAGAIGVDEELRIVVSGSAYGGASLGRWFTRFHGRRLVRPHSTSMVVHPAFAAWHRREVFRPPVRG